MKVTHKVQTALLLALLLLLLAPARATQAHAAFVRSDPAPNSVLPEHTHQVTIWFSEPLEPEFSEIQVLNTQGQQVDSGNSQVLADDPMAMTVSLPTLPDGTYTVVWRNVSTVDGHTLRGSFVLSFGEALPGAAAEGATEGAVDRAPLEPLARGLVLLGALTIVGGLLFERLLIMPLFFAPAAAPQTVATGQRLLRRARWLLWIAIIVLGAASAYQLAAQAATLFNVSLGDLQELYVSAVLRTTDWGQFWLWRAWLFSIIVVYAASLTATTLIAAPAEMEGGAREEEDLVGAIARALALLAALGILLTISLTSHAAAMVELRAAAVFSDFLHLVASAVWVGGLFHFALAARPVFSMEPAQRRALLADLVPRFSTLALLSVGTLVITGLYSTWAQVAIVPALLTPYGLTLLAKLALFIPLLVLGAINLLRLSPQLRGENGASLTGNSDAVSLTANRSTDAASPNVGANLQFFELPLNLRRTVTLEALLGLAIILIVGLLTGLEPARQVAAREGVGQERTLTFEDSVEGTDMALTVEPALTGANDLVVELYDAQGRPIADASGVTLELTYLEADMGAITIPLHQGQEETEYVAEDVLLSVAGDWQAALVVQRPDAFDARTAFRFDVRAGETLPTPVRVGYVLWGIELVLLGALFAAVSLPLGSWRTRPGLALVTPGALALIAGFIIALGAPFFVAGAQEELVNPYPPTAESIEAGREVYVENCQSCHGASGLGDGPAGVGLQPPPADLVYHVPLHPDDDLFITIVEGNPGTAMPAFGDRLSEEQIWHLVNYLRTLAE